MGWLIDGYIEQYQKITIGAPSLDPKHAASIRQRGRDYAHGKLTLTLSQRWLDHILEEVERMREAGVPIRYMISGYNVVQARIIQVLSRKVSDIEVFSRLSQAHLQLSLLETEVISSRINALQREDAARQLDAHASLFREQISTALNQASNASHTVQSRQRCGCWCTQYAR